MKRPSELIATSPLMAFLPGVFGSIHPHCFSDCGNCEKHHSLVRKWSASPYLDYSLILSHNSVRKKGVETLPTRQSTGSCAHCTVALQKMIGETEREIRRIQESQTALPVRESERARDIERVWQYVEGVRNFHLDGISCQTEREIAILGESKSITFIEMCLSFLQGTCESFGRARRMERSYGTNFRSTSLEILAAV